MSPLAAIRGATARHGRLEDGESIEERVFATTRACLERASVERGDVDAVVIAADDLADGRSITTMLHATAAGAYLKDEIRTTNGSLAALGLGALRVASGMSGRVLVVSWWLPSADDLSIARASLDARGSRALIGAERLVPVATSAVCAACVLEPPSPGDRLALRGFSLAQADYDGWLAGVGEPAGALSRLGTRLPTADAGPGAVTRLRLPPFGDWSGLCEAAGVEVAPDDAGCERWGGLADGLARIADLEAGADALPSALVATTGLPAFLQVEAAVVGPA